MNERLCKLGLLMGKFFEVKPISESGVCNIEELVGIFWCNGGTIEDSWVSVIVELVWDNEKEGIAACTCCDSNCRLACC